MVKLTEKLVLARARANDLSNVKTLNCWGSGLTDVSVLQHLSTLKVVNLSANELTKLDDFEACYSLKELYLRKNKIQQLDAIDHLQDLKELKLLWLSGNPFCDELSNEEYRLSVIRRVPQVQILDNIPVTLEERQKALASNLEETSEDNELIEDVSDHEEQSSNVSNNTLPSTSEISENIDLVNTGPEISSDLVNTGSENSSDLVNTESENNIDLVNTETEKSSDSVNIETQKTSDLVNTEISENIDLVNTENENNPANPNSKMIETAASDDTNPSSTPDQSALELSLEETNQLRIQLGLKPMSVEKYGSSISPPFKPSRKHTTTIKNSPQTEKRDVLNETLALVNLLDQDELIELQDVVKNRLSTITDRDQRAETSIKPFSQNNNNNNNNVDSNVELPAKGQVHRMMQRMQKIIDTG
uniref:protein C21orf2 homolog isoform X2 n=1 Tax=Ciona intestinalis TaxID=7719 RepID=UPI000180BF44|nr:protein C21orf2 homolog isoform X2 [Ciona intestinalis]|eukprot:XP_009858986.1 protein C21orf2 homolog isoform X2 [Ciona intestinalis]